MPDNLVGIDKSNQGRLKETVTATATGDLIVHDGTDLQKLAVGTNGQVLTADSAESTGIKWASASGGGGGTVLLDSTATAADINAAWTASIHTVFLTAGTYDENGGGGMTTQITVPAGKKLVGSAMGALEDTLQTGHVRMEWSGNPTGGALTLEEGASVQGVHVVKTGALGTVGGIVQEASATTTTFFEVIDCHCFNWAVGFEFPLTSAGSATTGLRLRGCVADACTEGFEVRYATNAADERVMIEMTHCVARDCTNNGFQLALRAGATAESDVYANVTYCEAINNGADGFLFSDSGADAAAARGQVFVAFNNADGNGGDGFDVTAWAGATLAFNRAVDNTLFGFDIPLQGGSVTTHNRRGVFYGNEAYGNGSGDIEYNSSSETQRTWTGRWANSSGVQHGAGTTCVEAGSITGAELQDILNMDEIHTVLLRVQDTSGDAAIDLVTTSLNVPDGKRLIGANASGASESIPSSGQLRVIYQGTGVAIDLDAGAAVYGLQVAQTGTGGTGTGINLSQTGCVVEGCEILDFSIGVNVSSSAVGGSIVRDTRAETCTTGFVQDATASTFQTILLDSCVAQTCTTGFDIDGSTGGRTVVRHCWAVACTGTGFNQRSNWGATAAGSDGHVQVHGCVAKDCGGDGFDLANFTHGGTIVTDCRATNCTGTGFICANGDTERQIRPYIGNCVSAGNGTEYNIDGTWARGTLQFNEPTSGTTTNVACDSTERCLAVHSALNLKTVATTTLLTAGTSEYVVVTKIVVYIRTINITSPHTVNPIANVQTLTVGDIIASTTLQLAVSGTDTQYAIIQPARDGSAIQKVQPGNNLQFDLTTGADGTSLTADIQVWGYANPFV